MCGIAGSINYPLDIPLLTKDLFHRGPDEQTTFSENGLILHHHRLAILDIAGGKQPMHLGHLTIIFNGEIYNHLDVRDGMFAFVIYDRRRKEIFIARDRAGKKPLYYYADGKSLIFSSELGALNNQLSLQINEDHL